MNHDVLTSVELPPGRDDLPHRPSRRALDILCVYVWRNRSNNDKQKCLSEIHLCSTSSFQLVVLVMLNNLSMNMWIMLLKVYTTDIMRTGSSYCCDASSRMTSEPTTATASAHRTTLGSSRLTQHVCVWATLLSSLVLWRQHRD